MAWISPTGHETPTDWTNPEHAYDEDLNFGALSPWFGVGEYSSFLVLTHDALTSDRLRFMAEQTEVMGVPMFDIDVDVYKDGVWVHVYEGTYPNKVWQEKTFPEGSVTKIKLRFYGVWSGEDFLAIYEVDFWEVEAPAWGGSALPQLQMAKAILGL